MLLASIQPALRKEGIRKESVVNMYQKGFRVDPFSMLPKHYEKWKKWRIVGPRGGIADLSWVKKLDETVQEIVPVTRLDRPEATAEVRCPEFAYSQKMARKAKKRQRTTEGEEEEEPFNQEYAFQTLLPIYPAGYVMSKANPIFFESLKEP